MGKVINWEEAKRILEQQPRRLIIKEDTGPIEIVFKSQIEAVEPGETDLSGMVWNSSSENVWTKHEAKVEINGITQILSLGGERSPLLLGILNICIQNNIRPEDIVGTKWRIERVGNKYDISYLGRVNNESVNTEAVDEMYIKIKKTIESIKLDMPEYLSSGIPKDEFVSAVTIKGNMLGFTDITRGEVEKYIKKLCDDGVIKESNGLIRG